MITTPTTTTTIAIPTTTAIEPFSTAPNLFWDDRHCMDCMGTVWCVPRHDQAICAVEMCGAGNWTPSFLNEPCEGSDMNYVAYKCCPTTTPTTTTPPTTTTTPTTTSTTPPTTTITYPTTTTPPPTTTTTTPPTTNTTTTPTGDCKDDPNEKDCGTYWDWDCVSDGKGKLCPDTCAKHCITARPTDPKCFKRCEEWRDSR